MTSSHEITGASADGSDPSSARSPAAADTVASYGLSTGGTGSGARVTPPPLPGCAPSSFAAQSDSQREFAADYRSLDGPAGAPAVVEGLLKHPARMAFEVCDGDRRLQVGLRVAGVMTAGFVVYGALMGLFGGGVQLWRVPLKVMGGLWASLLLCLSSFYIFACLGGINLGVTRVAALLLEALAGLTGLARLRHAMFRAAGARRGRRVFAAWLLLTGAAGSELSWWFCPFLSRPDRPPMLANPNAFRMNMYAYLGYHLFGVGRPPI